MARQQLSESLTKEEVSIAITKALTQAPLTVAEINELQSVDVGKLIVEHDLSFPAAEKVLVWIQNERLRVDGQMLYTGVEDRPLEGTPLGSPSFNNWLEEAKEMKGIRGTVREEIVRAFKEKKR